MRAFASALVDLRARLAAVAVGGVLAMAAFPVTAADANAVAPPAAATPAPPAVAPSAVASTPAPPAVAAPPAPATPASSSATRYPVLCQYVVSPGFIDKLTATWDFLRSHAEVDVPDPIACPTKRPREDRTLVGPGDVVVVVNDADYAAALDKAGEAPLHLFLNGFDLGRDGKLVSVQRGAGKAALRFHAGTGRSSQPFWTTVYNDHGIVAAAPVQAGIGWTTEPVFGAAGSAGGPQRLYVSVTSWAPLLFGTLFGGALVLFFWWALRNSDTFRVAPLYPWWLDARSLRAQIHKAVLPIGSAWRGRAPSFDLASNRKTIEAAIQSRYPDFEWPADLTDYEKARRSALGGSVPADSPAIRSAVIGLALDQDRWRPLRLPYSLTRVQWGAWMMFTVTAAVYLWLVYGAFPALEGSVLGLVAISTITAGASFIADKNVGLSASYSRGLVYDLMTGANEDQQAHRFQAIVVNVLLFAVGVMYVFQHLAYPTFDSTWLELLGLSGFAQTAGKQLLEKPDPARPATP